MEYTGFRIGVFYKTPEWRDKWVKDFRSKYESDIIGITSFNGDYTFHLYGRVVVKTVNICRDCRGLAFDKAFVEPTIDDKDYSYRIELSVKIPRIEYENK